MNQARASVLIEAGRQRLLVRSRGLMKNLFQQGQAHLTVP
jgi:hypothetical protein